MTLKDLKNDREITAIISVSEEQIERLGYTEHSIRHVSIVAKRAGELLKKLGYDEQTVNAAEIAGYLHDIGNSVSRIDHAQSGAILAYRLLTERGMDYRDAAEIMMAIGNHDEQFGVPVSAVSAALIIADKSDVHKSRVKKSIEDKYNVEDIHDRVNLAAESSFITVDEENKRIVLEVTIDTAVCEVVDYFKIYLNRMNMCTTAAKLLGYDFGLEINKVRFQ